MYGRPDWDIVALLTAFLIALVVLGWLLFR